MTAAVSPLPVPDPVPSPFDIDEPVAVGVPEADAVVTESLLAAGWRAAVLPSREVLLFDPDLLALFRDEPTS